jgi:formate hydrogenlyase subunit 6/NADH:ubiquinone oxidoreductase subunit I
MIRFLLRLAISKPVTTAYPEQSTPPARGLRGTPTLVADRCNLTGACEAACPTRAIIVARDSTGAGSWQIDYGNCIFCGACVQACPEDAIVPSDGFELTVRQRKDAVVVHELRPADD